MGWRVFFETPLGQRKWFGYTDGSGQDNKFGVKMLFCLCCGRHNLEKVAGFVWLVWK